MIRSFQFDDGQTWHMELTRMTYQARDSVAFGARFWTEAAPEQQVLGRLPPRALTYSEAQLAESLRRALRHLTNGVELDA